MGNKKLTFQTVTDAVNHFYRFQPEGSTKWLGREDEIADHMRQCHVDELIVIEELK